MTRRPVAKSKFYIVLDEDRRLFNVQGPLLDDSELTRRVSEAQQQRRRVRLAEHSASDARGAAVKWAEEFYRFTYTDECLV